MIRAKICFVAEGISIDRETNQVSAFGLVESLQADAFPLFFQKLFFFCLWERENSDPAHAHADFSVTMNGREIARQSVVIDFEQLPRNRCIIRIDNFSVSEPEKVGLRLAIPGHAVAEWSLEARHAAASAPRPVDESRQGLTYESRNISISLGHVNVNRR